MPPLAPFDWGRAGGAGSAGWESKETCPAAGWTLETDLADGAKIPGDVRGVDVVSGAKGFAATGFGSPAQANVWRLALTSKPSRAVLAIVFIDLPDLAT